MKGIEWGCRVSCFHPKCDQHVESWSNKGTPTIPHGGSYNSGPLKGWFIKYLDGHRYVPASYAKGHVAYCPEHSAPATEWQAKFQEWQSEQHQVGKSAAIPFLDRVAEWISPSGGRLQRDRAARDARYAWLKDHPAPRPPWRG